MGGREDGKTGRGEDGKTGRRGDGKTGRREEGKTGRREDGKTGGREDGRTGRREDGKRAGDSRMGIASDCVAVGSAMPRNDSLVGFLQVAAEAKACSKS